MDLLKLSASSQLSDLPARAVEALEMAMVQDCGDPRGQYLEFAPGGYKPFRANDIMLLSQAGFIEINEKDSDPLPSFDEACDPDFDDEQDNASDGCSCDVEVYDGVCFASITEKAKQALPDFA